MIPILTSASLLKDERGAVIGTLGVIKDLTEKKKLEEDLKKAQADLVQTEKLAAIGRLASGVAHEMNDPLTSILTFGNLLREDTAGGRPQPGESGYYRQRGDPGQEDRLRPSLLLPGG